MSGSFGTCLTRRLGTSCLHARLAFIELARLYDGSNNGRIAMSARRLADLIPCNKDTAAKVLRELEDSGFIETIRMGKFTRKEEDRRASEYRLTCFRCDVTGDPPSRRFKPNIRWEACDRPAKRDRSVRGDRTNVPSSQESVRPNQTLNAKINPSSVRPNHTHLNSSHGVTALRSRHSSQSSLPPGFSYCKKRGGIVTADGVAVPLVDHPLVGSEKERAALAQLRKWQAEEEKNGGSGNVLVCGGKPIFPDHEVFAFWADMTSLDSEGLVRARLYLLPSEPNTDGREVSCILSAAALDALEKHGAKRLPTPIPNE